MTPDEARAFLRTAWDAYDRGDVEAFDACVAPDWEERDLIDWHAPGRPLDAIHEEMAEFRIAFPDKRTEFVRVIAEGEWIFAVVRTTATHSGPFRGLEPTGTHVINNEITVHRLQGGRFAAMWAHSDGPSYHRQIAAEPHSR
jgi:predicted ester cyclase